MIKQKVTIGDLGDALADRIMQRMKTCVGCISFTIATADGEVGCRLKDHWIMEDYEDEEYFRVYINVATSCPDYKGINDE